MRPENNFSKNREREITFTEIREREIRRYIDNREYIYLINAYMTHVNSVIIQSLTKL